MNCWFAAGAMALLGGCLEPTVTRCNNGAICPTDQACTETADKENHPVCGELDEVSACFGMPDRTACKHLDGSPGSCADNLCSTCNVNWTECRYQTWTAMDAGTGLKVQSVAVFGASDAVAVAGNGLIHYDGTSWQPVAGPPSVSALTDVWGTSKSDLFVVDTSKHIFRGDDLTAPDGTSVSALFGIGGSSSDDLIAVGTSRTIGHRSSTGWSAFVSGGGGEYDDVWSTGGTTYVVGADLTSANLWTVTGTTATVVGTFPNPTAILHAVWSPAAGDVYVAGKLNNNAAVFHYNGAWEQMTVPAVAAEIESLWGTSASDIYAVGTGATILHFNGSAWTVQPAVAGITADLFDVYGFDGDVFAVGDLGTIWKRAR